MQEPSMKDIRVQIILLLLVAVLAGCGTGGWGVTPTPTLDPSLIDSSILTGLPCAAPCWYGLEPDKSSASAVYATLNRLPFVDPTTIVEWGYIWLDDDKATQVGFSCLHPKDKGCGGSLVISQGKLKEITLSLSYKLTFQKAVGLLNQPDFIDYRPADPEGNGCIISMIWLQRGIYLTNAEPKNGDQCRMIRESGKVSPDITVTQIFYVLPEVLEAGPKGYFNDSIPWPGFAK
jgi:hypothetical protein